MAGTKISALGTLSTLADGTIVPVVDSGTNYKLAATSIKTYVLAGTVTATNFAATSNGAGTSFKVGDDAWIGDVNLSNGFAVRGVQDASQGYIIFGNANNTTYIGRSGTGAITVTGNFATTGTTAIGTDANFTDWANAKVVISQANTGHSHAYNFGVVGEAVADATDSTKWGIGVYGRGNTNGAQRSGGVLGDGGVTNTADTGSAIGVRGYADDTHAGGLNVGLYASASNGASNYALYMNAGDIYSGAAQTWALNGALSFSGAYDVGISNNLVISNNNKSLIFKTTTGANVSLIQQNDDNLVLYSTNAAGAQRAVWSVFGQSSTSSFTVSVPTNLTNGAVTVKDVRDTVYAIASGSGTSAGTITPDCANGNLQTVTLTGSITLNAFANPVSGQSMTIIITQPSSGGPYTLTSSMKFANANKTLSTAANAVDIVTVSYIGSTYYASLITGFA